MTKTFTVGDTWVTESDDDSGEYLAKITEVWPKDENQVCGRCEMYHMDDIRMKNPKGNTGFSENWLIKQISKELTPEYWL